KSAATVAGSPSPVLAVFPRPLLRRRIQLGPRRRDEGLARPPVPLAAGRGRHRPLGDRAGRRRLPSHISTKKNTGVRKTPNAVTPLMPLSTDVPIERHISAPAPAASTHDTTPTMNAMHI